DAAIRWLAANFKGQQDWSLPVVAETYDGYLNDTLGFHVKEKHVFAALDSARGGAVAEGNVGGGTGMICFGFKGGVGTAAQTMTGRYEHKVIALPHDRLCEILKRHDRLAKPVPK